jgi:ABC-type transport system involved in multi-copper enzyme maturation permease subunit
MTIEENKLDVFEKEKRKFEIDFNPVLINELRQRSRSRSLFFVFSFFLIIIGLTVGLIYISLAQENNNIFMGILVTRQFLGKIMFWSVAGLDILAVILFTPWILSSTISSEREEQTLDLLAITSMPMRSIIFGKLAAGFIVVTLLVVISLPFQSLVFILGGVSLEETVIYLLVVILTTIMMCSTVLFFSSLLRNSGQALAWSIGSSVLLFFILPLIMFLLVPLFLAWDNAAGSSQYALLVDLIVILSGWILISINPITAMTVSAGLWTNSHILYIYSFPLKTGGSFPLFSPWVLFSIICVLMSLFLFWASTHFAGKLEK